VRNQPLGLGIQQFWQKKKKKKVKRKKGQINRQVIRVAHKWAYTVWAAAKSDLKARKVSQSQY